jgi:drug/metabolite transporter (DMT)-like permease
LTQTTANSTGRRQRLPYLLLGALLCLDVGAYLFEKTASSRASGEGVRFLFSILHQPFFWAATALGPVQLFAWTQILGRIDLSVAYPVSGLNMPLTLVAAVVLLGERLSWQAWIGAALITLGGAIIGPGGGKTYHPPQSPPG